MPYSEIWSIKTLAFGRGRLDIPKGHNSNGFIPKGFCPKGYYSEVSYPEKSLYSEDFDYTESLFRISE